jgi:hypothetical protein
MRDEYWIAKAIVLANWLSTNRGKELEKGEVYNVPGYLYKVKATKSLIELAKNIVRDWGMVVIKIEKECLPPLPPPICGRDPNENWAEGFCKDGVNVVPGEKRE